MLLPLLLQERVAEVRLVRSRSLGPRWAQPLLTDRRPRGREKQRPACVSARACAGKPASIKPRSPVSCLLGQKGFRRQLI